MTSSLTKILTTPQALERTLNSDGQVYRWFIFLVSQRQVQVDFKEIDGGVQLFLRLRRILAGETFLYLAAVLYGSILFYFQWDLYVLGLIFFLGVLAGLRYLKKRCVVPLSLGLIKKDFPAEILSQKTLYQIGEFYSKKYDCPSLVDTIYFVDDISRKVIVAAVVFTVFIYPHFSLGQIFFIPFIFYALAQGILRFNFVYRRLK